MSDTIGTRLLSLRKHCRYSRRIFCEKHSFSEVSLRGWEMNLVNLTQKNLNKLIHAYKQEDIEFDIGWLKYGYISRSIKDISSDPSERFKEEMNTFEKQSDKNILVKINEYACAPLIPIGSYIGAHIVAPEDYILLKSQMVLMYPKKEHHQFFLRKVIDIYDNNTLSFTSLKPDLEAQNFPFGIKAHVEKVALPDVYWLNF